MRSIVFFHPSSDLYGADKILVYVMKNFDCAVKKLVLLEDGPLVELVKKECPDVDITIAGTMPKMAKMYLKGTGIFRFFINLFRFNSVIKEIKKTSPDVVYINTLALGTVLYYFSGKKYRKITHVHEILTNDRFLHRIINKIALSKSDRLICVSEAVRKNLQELGYKNKLVTVHNGISFRNDASEQIFDVDRQKTNFALIGRIKPLNKGQILLLDAFSRLDSNRLDKSHLYIVGSPVPGQEYMQKEVEDRIVELGLEKHVTIVPFIKEIESVYKAVDVVCVPSMMDDPFPTTVLEGMYWSRPVVGTATGGIPEMIDNGVTGFVCRRNDPSDLKEKLQYFIDSRECSVSMGIAGRKRFEENFTEERFNIRFRKAIAEILAE